jgi:hypothetical protein
VCFPPGANATAALAAPHINAVSSMFVNSGKWAGTVVNVVFKLYDDQLTLPRNLLNILGAETRGTGTRSLLHQAFNVQNEWYQFLPGGPGILVNQPDDVQSFVPSGDGVVTFRDLPSAGTLKIVTTANESSGLKFHVRGRHNGAKVFTMESTTQVEGENASIPVTQGSSVTFGATFDELYSIVKPVTNGVILLYHVADDNTQTLIGSYEPGETLPSYRKYYVPRRADDTDVIVARCKIRHVPALVDNDEIIPSNLNALEMGLQALGFRRNSDMGNYNSFMGMAYGALNQELEQETPEQALGRVQIDAGLSDNMIGVL